MSVYTKAQIESVIDNAKFYGYQGELDYDEKIKYLDWFYGNISSQIVSSQQYWDKLSKSKRYQ